MAAPDIFLSYNREDGARVKRFADALTAEGFTVWWDVTLRSGENYDEVTETALREAKAVVVLWSPRSVGSRWVRAEATEGERAGKLVPAMIEPCKRPIMFELKQTAELSHWKGNRKDLVWQAFVEDVRGHVGGSASAPRDATPVAKSPDIRRWAMIAAALTVIVAALAILWAQFGSSDAGGKSVELMVMPFKASGSKPDESALATGITDELIVRLRRIDDLRIVSGADGGASFNADYRIDGSVRLDGNELRVSPRLLDGDGNVLWSDNFERAVDDMFNVQEEIATAVTNTLSVSLDVGIESREYGGTDNPEAYANYFRGRVARWSGDANRFRYLERAVELDPKYIKAWQETAIAYGFGLFAITDWGASREALSKMDRASAKALSLNPELWIGQSARGWYEATVNDFAAADRRFRRMGQQDKGKDPELRLLLINFGIQLGRIKHATELAQSLELIDPIYRDAPIKINYLLYEGKYNQAIDRYQKIRKTNPGEAAGIAPAIFWELLMAEGPGKASEFAKANGLGPLQRSVPNVRYDAEEFPNLPLKELRQWADRKFGASARTQIVERAWLASYLGNSGLAMDYLKVAYEHPGMGANQLIWHPVLAPVRKTDAFEEWIEKRGIVAAWRESGDWGDFCKPLPSNRIACT